MHTHPLRQFCGGEGLPGGNFNYIPKNTRIKQRRKTILAFADNFLLGKTPNSLTGGGKIWYDFLVGSRIVETTVVSAWLLELFWKQDA